MRPDPNRLRQIAERVNQATQNGKYDHDASFDDLAVWEYDSSAGPIAECTRPEIADLFGHAADDLRYLLGVVEDLTRQRQPIPRKLRYSLLRRAGFRCETCGASPQDDGVRLEIDHIHPVSRGGTNDPSNLRVLCRDCNAGKGAGPA